MNAMMEVLPGPDFIGGLGSWANQVFKAYETGKGPPGSRSHGD